MMTHEQKTRLGIFLIIATAIFIIVLGFFLVPVLREQGDHYFINFQNISVNGLDVGSLVKYQGVQIGKVTKMEVNRRDLNSVLVNIKIQRGFPVKEDTTAFLTYIGITGLRFIDLKGGTPDARPVSPRGEIQVGRGIEERAGDIVTNLDSAIRSLNALLSEKNRDNVSLFLQNVEKGTGTISSVLESRKAKLELALDNIEKASTDFSTVMESLRSAAAKVDTESSRISKNAEAALDNINKRFSDAELGKTIADFRTLVTTATDSLRRIDASLIGQKSQVGEALDRLGAALDNLARFTREISEDPTSLIRERKDKKK